MELRKDPITQSWVILGSHDAASSEASQCPFDPGVIENVSPILSWPAEGTWQVRVLPHLDPLYRIEGDPGRFAEGIYDKMGAIGAHEIIVETRQHDKKLAELSDEAIEAMASFAGTSPSPFTFAPFFEHWHGAVNRVGVTDTAFPHRCYSYNFIAWSSWENASDSQENIQWTRNCWEAMQPFLIEGSYVNYVSDEGDAFARAAYGANYERLVALKNKYDPTNFFRMNHNIRPTIQAKSTAEN